MGPAIPVQFWGTYAQYIVLSEKHLAHVPAGVTMKQAAAIPLVGMTVAQAFRYAGFEPLDNDLAIGTDDSATSTQGAGQGAPKKPKKRVLIHAAAGGVGHIAVQYASRVLGLEVIGTASPGPSTDLAIKSGAAAVVNYRAEPFEEADAVVGSGGIDISMLLTSTLQNSRALRGPHS